MPDVAPSVSTSDLLAEHAAGWLGAASRRRSRRAYDHTPADLDSLEAIDHLCGAWRPHDDARVALVKRPTVDVFTGVVGSYGRVVGSPHLLVFIGDERADFTDQHVGYTGEALILEAARLGLATCWVGGFFNPRKVAEIIDLAPGERVFAVSPLGHPRANHSLSERVMAGMAGAHHRKPVAEIAPGIDPSTWPDWAVAAVETARVAPSALNRQPWMFRLEGGCLVVAKDSAFETPKVTKRLDIGIATLHVTLAAQAHDVTGRWVDLTGMDVARFEPDASR